MGIRIIDVPAEEVAQLCRRWKVAELSLFGSAARDEAGPDSDVDLLVRFEDGERWSTLDLARLVIELEQLIGREVDLIEDRAVENPFKRRAILAGRRVLYAA